MKIISSLLMASVPLVLMANGEIPIPSIRWTNECYYTDGCTTNVEQRGSVFHLASDGRLYLEVYGSGVLAFKGRGSWDGFFYVSDEKDIIGNYITNEASFDDYQIEFKDGGWHTVLWATYAKGYLIDEAWGELEEIRWNGEEVCKPAQGITQNDGEYTINVKGLDWKVELKDREIRLAKNCITQSYSGEAVIPSSFMGYPVTEICDSAFIGCAHITYASIPETVRKIGASAFYGCSQLKQIGGGNGVCEINTKAFGGCSSLTMVNVSKLSNIEATVFAGCKALTGVSLPSSVTNIGAYAFSGCKLKSSFTIPNSVVSIGSFAFKECTELKSVVIPDGVKRIENGTFKGCPNVAAVDLPDSVTSIGDEAFSECGCLTRFQMSPNVKRMGRKAFFNCKSLASITLPLGIGNIDEYTFCGCEALGDIDIPNGVTNIDFLAFGSCYSLTNVAMPRSVVKLGVQVFDKCRALKELAIPSSVKEIGTFCFTDCRDLSSLILPDGLVKIPNGLFSLCENLTHVFVPKSVTEIGRYVFQECNCLTQIYVYPNDGARMKELLRSAGYDALIDCVVENAPLIEKPSIKSYCGTIDADNETSLLTGSCLVVAIECDTDYAVIHYTLDGSNPTAQSETYRKPFKVTDSKTVKAIALKTDYANSEIATLEIVKRWTIGDALNLPDAKFTFSGAAEWVTDSAVSHDGVASARSGAIRGDKETVIKTTVSGSGKIMFYWKASCEKTPAPPWYYDNGTFKVDGKEVAWIDGIMEDWERCEIAIAGSGEHDLEWMYSKDDSEVFGDDCVWVDQVTWIPDADAVTVKSEVPVSFKWLYDKGLLNNDDPESAVMKRTGKLDGAGRELTVEDEFVSGTDPTKAESHFRVGIEFEDGKPIVKWEPDLNEGGTKHLRNYTTWGCQALGGQWVDYNAVPDTDRELYKFFKVTVSMP